MTPTQPRPSIASVSVRIDDHEKRIDDLETRLAKYDVIIVKLDTLIDVLTRRVEDTAHKADEAIEGQDVLKERNEGAHRWSTTWIAVATGLIVGILSFLLGHVLH